MTSYPISARVFTSPPPFAFRSRLRSPIGRWIKTPVDIDTDAATVALACRLTRRYGNLAITIAVAVRTRLVAFMARDMGNDDGNVMRYTPDVLAFACGWPEDAGSLTDALESAGITVDGRYRHWHVVVGNFSPQDQQRMQTRDRVRRHRARAKAGTIGADDSVTQRYTVTIATDNLATAYKERARTVARKGLERHTHRVSQSERHDTPPTPTVSPAVAALSRIWKDKVPAAVAQRITEAVANIERWERTCAAWEASGWHLGPRAVTAMLDRYRQDADAPKQRQAKGFPRPVRANVVTTPTRQAEPIVTEPERTIIPSDREGFRRAFEGTPFAGRIATATPPTTTVARAVPDLATMSRPDRAVAMAAMIARIGQPS